MRRYDIRCLKMLRIDVSAENEIRALPLAVVIGEADGTQYRHFALVGPMAGFLAIKAPHRSAVLDQMTEISTASARLWLPRIPDADKLASDSHRRWNVLCHPHTRGTNAVEDGICSQISTKRKNGAIGRQAANYNRIWHLVRSVVDFNEGDAIITVR